MTATGLHTYTCDGCHQDLDGNGMVILLDVEKAQYVHFHSYDCVKLWADQRHAEHSALVAQVEAETKQRVTREAMNAVAALAGPPVETT